MISEQERIVRISQGYDIGFEFNSKKYWINSDAWNDEKEEKMFQQTGLRTFREKKGKKNLVFYNPEFFEVYNGLLSYKGSLEKDIPQPINMSTGEDMFRHSNVEIIDLSNWDVSNVTDMSYMFSNCTNLQSLDLSNWDVSNVTDMYCMFSYCKNLQSLDLSNWDVSNVTDMRYMFSNCTNLQSLDLSNWDVSNVTDMSYMFENCTNLQFIDLSNWDVSNVTDMRYMFDNCINLQSIDLSNWNLCNVDTVDMFYNCKNLQKRYRTLDAQEILKEIIPVDSSNEKLGQLRMF